MYLVTEAEYNKLNKRRKKSNLPQDVQLVTESLKATSQKRKKQGLANSLPRIQLRKYNVDGGVASMTDRDVTKALPQPRRAAPRQHSTIKQRLRHAAGLPPLPARTMIGQPLQHSTPTREHTAFHSFDTPTIDLSGMRQYAV